MVTISEASEKVIEIPESDGTPRTLITSRSIAMNTPRISEMSDGTVLSEVTPLTAIIQGRKFPIIYRFRQNYAPYLAEFLGTLVLVFVGLSVVNQVLLNYSQVAGSWLSVNIGWGFSLSIAIYVNSGVSGAHLNPAVTLAFAAFKKFPLRRVPGYIFSQVLGAFVAACLVYSVFYPMLDQFDGGVRQVSGPKSTAGFFATYPQEYLRNGNAFYTELLSTAILVMGIFASQEFQVADLAEFAPIFLGVLLMTIGICTGYLTSYSLNPARDLGPRIFTSIAGWGRGVWTEHDYYFWVPLAGPIVGALLGGILYELFICTKTPNTARTRK
ncbi:aquaporin [Basidiobolus meristosporus CBS 931.73]|uniref:Aquaporin n=1 Tax=Basidiobolus meristosporus CBS 931.73 TaxID=1314790 RepID=A0A1Y1XIZ7_9FUNG|nr:aquaporin [Basidiobolus meristosporus CBS 931.73]|eukprot:ORX85366.1 aquaporin [Basidiobolus meristosporus CBS 931.73]